ncbi:MAG: extracellular solute-binding protein, partial [Phycisphaeraceae bacterium]
MSDTLHRLQPPRRRTGAPIGFGLIVTLLALWLSGAPALANDAAESDQTVTFRSATLPNPVATSPDAQASRAVLRAFREEHPHINIERFSMPSVEGMAMDSGPLMAIAAGVPPHAIYVNFRQSSTYINHGFLEPLEVLLARVESDNPRVRQADAQGNWLEDPTPEEIEQARERILERVPASSEPVVYRQPWNEQVATQKHIWALPTTFLAHTLQYRKDHFQEVGLDPERPPRNWEELREYAKKLTDKERGRHGLLIGGGSTISWGMYNLLGPAGVEAMTRNEQGEWEGAFATEAAAEAILFLWKMVNEDESVYVRVGGGSNPWERGEVSMQFASLAEDLFADVNPQQVGIARVPVAPMDTNVGGLVNARMVGVFAGSSPQQKLAVMRYIWYLTGEEAQRIRTGVFVESGYGQFVNPLQLEKFGYTDLLRRVPQGWREAFEAGVENGTPEPFGRNTQFIYQRMSEPINRALLEEGLGGYTDEQAIAQILEWLQEAEDEVNTKTLGRLSEEQMQTRRVVGGIVLLMVVIAFTASMVWVWRAFSREEKHSLEGQPLRRFITGYILLAPVVALLVFWDYGPLSGGALISLFDFELVIDSSFVGIDNFANAVFDDRFWAAFGRTFLFAALAVGLGFWPPILLALLLDEVPTEAAKYTFRTIFYLPQIISGVIVVFLWRQLYAENGALNQIMLSANMLGDVSATLVKWVLLAIWLSLVALLLWLPFKLDELSWPVRGGILAAGLALVGVTLSPLISAYIGPSEVMLNSLAQQGQNPADYMGWSAVWATLSQLVGAFDFETTEWLNQAHLAMLFCVIPMVWASAGPGCIIYLAALKTVPQ